MPYDRDWLNFLNFKGCKDIEGKSTSARPDFFLKAESARFGAVVLLGNDEFAHRQYPCDLQRTWNIVQSLNQTKEFKDVPIVYIRVNPHVFQKGKVYYDPPLAATHALVLSAIRKLTREDLKHAVNLVVINYDRDVQGNLTLFQKAREKENDFGPLLESCVILSV